MPRCATTWPMRSIAADCCRAPATATRRNPHFPIASTNSSHCCRATQVGGNLDSAVRLLRRTCRPPEALESVLLRSRSDERLKSALKLEPRNPRAVFLSSHGGTAPSQTRHAAAAAGILAAAACRATVRRELGDQHRRSGLGTCRGVSGPRPRAAGARRSIGRPQLDREVLDRRTGLTRRRSARWHFWCGHIPRSIGGRAVRWSSTWYDSAR